MKYLNSELSFKIKTLLSGFERIIRLNLVHLIHYKRTRPEPRSKILQKNQESGQSWVNASANNLYSNRYKEQPAPQSGDESLR